ncbi:MAG TPA: hypothetical protein VG963_28640 [Polyangiaceae bacterium]|nr:hypothetical protein [Steroidobacteraceae bacterium]HVZ36444.1 hypothetical protein [Polyangiaceae bacterium]
MAALDRLHAAGLRVTAMGDTLLVEPRTRLTDELRAYIRQHKPVLLAELGQSGDRPSPAATPATDGGEGVATVAVAEPARPRDPEPETPSDRARREVLERLRANPQITRAFTTRWEAGALIVTLAVRDVGVCDLAIPRERIRDMADYAELLMLFGNPEGQA